MAWRETPAEIERARAERPFKIRAPRGTLFGVFTPPDPAAPPAGLCAVLLTRPRSHRNRMWVEGARHLAAKGFAAFRFDYHGCGDSSGEPARLDPNEPYRDDVIAVMRHLRDQLGQRRFVLYGSCFDARTSLSAFADEADAIEALVFVAAPCMELDDAVKVDADRKDWGHLWRAIRRPDNWRALGDPERWRYMATVLRRIASPRTGGEPADVPLSRSFVDHVRAMALSRARALFLYGADDPEYLSFRVAERTLWPTLPADARERFDVVVWPGAVHQGFLEMSRQRQILDGVLDWIERLHPGSSGSTGRAIGGTTEAAWTSV